MLAVCKAWFRLYLAQISMSQHRKVALNAILGHLQELSIVMACGFAVPSAWRADLNGMKLEMLEVLSENALENVEMSYEQPG